MPKYFIRYYPWFIVGVLAVLVVAGVVFAALNTDYFDSKDTTAQQSTPEIEIESVSVEFPIAVVSKFSSLGNNISQKDIPSRTVYMDSYLVDQLESDELESLVAKLELDSYEEFSTESIESINSSEYDANALVVTHPNRLNYKVKTLEIEDKNLFADKDYPLTVALERELGDEQIENLGFDRSQINSLFLGGEIIPARAVDRLFLNKTDNYTLLFDRVRADIQAADLAIAMLENPISGDPRPCTGCTTFVGDERNAKGFKEVGIDILGFGNHAGDGGLTAVQNTEKALAEEGIGFSGVSSKNLNDANNLVIRDFGDKKLGFLAADDVAWFYWAGENRWGTNRFSTRVGGRTQVDHDRIKKVISDAKSEVDYLVVMVSWGIEYTNTANAHQTEMAHAFIDNGVDMVVSSHPHWVQNFEVYKDKPILYSLGNFVFDQTHTEQTRQGMVSNAYFYRDNLVSFEFKPTLICGYHQTHNNLAGKIISKEMSYADVDNTPEAQGCVYWQPKYLEQSRPEYKQIWDRFMESTIL